MKNNCTQISTTSCIKYTGPSIPAFNVFCDEDLDIVLTNLASALADSIAQKGLDFGKVKDTTCLQFTIEERTRLNLMLDKIVNKVCELYSLKTFTPKANDIIVDLELLFKNQASEYYHCFDEITAPNCKTTISLTSFISDILSQLCDKFDNLQAQLDEASVDVTTLKYTGAQVKNNLNCQSSLTDSQQVTILDLLKLSEDKDKSIIQLITGTSACSASTITLATNTLGIGTTQTSVKGALDDVIAKVKTAINAVPNQTDYSVTTVSATNTGAYKASITVAQSGSSDSLTATINVSPHYARLATNYSTYTLSTYTTTTNNYSIAPLVLNSSNNTNSGINITNSRAVATRDGAYNFRYFNIFGLDLTGSTYIANKTLNLTLHLLEYSSGSYTSIARLSQGIILKGAFASDPYAGGLYYVTIQGDNTLNITASQNKEYGIGISINTLGSETSGVQDSTIITKVIGALTVLEFTN